MRIIKPQLILVGLLFVFSCQNDDDDTITGPTTPSLDDDLVEAIDFSSNGVGKDFYVLPASDDFGAIPQDPLNPLTAAKVQLGELLYHETGLGLSPMLPEGEQTYSCASCHFASAGFQAGRFQGIGEGGIGFGQNGESRDVNPNYAELELDVQPIRSPSAMNAAYQDVMLWNGQFGATGTNAGTEASWTPGTPIATNHLGYQGIEIQAIAGLQVHRMEIDSFPEVLAQLGYDSMFDQVFSNVPQDERYSREHTGLAIAAYERTLLANEAPFQKWLKGDANAMSDQEKRGAILFFGDAGCASCHNGPGLNSMEFHAIGMNDLFDCIEPTFKTLPDNTENFGRGGFTGNPEDMFKFKVPQLYNLADSPFFGHGASMRSIKAVIEYKNAAIPENPDVPATQLAEGFVPLELTDAEINDLTIFVKFALRDPNLARYEPENLPSGNCFPFNDPSAAADLGCD